jgi:hypothetical protein
MRTIDDNKNKNNSTNSTNNFTNNSTTTTTTRPTGDRLHTACLIPELFGVLKKI